MDLLPHVLLENRPILEDPLAVKANVLPKFLVQEAEKLFHEHDVVGESHAEVVIKVHVVEQDLPVAREHLPAEKADVRELVVFPFLHLLPQNQILSEKQMHKDCEMTDENADPPTSLSL